MAVVEEEKDAGVAGISGGAHQHGAPSPGPGPVAHANGQSHGTEIDPSGEVVDFDALNAALGALPPPPPSSSGSLASSAPDSEGRSSATYSSARPHTIPPTRAPLEDPNAPAVIVQIDETIQSGPPQQMTMPLGPGMLVPSDARPQHPAPDLQDSGSFATQPLPPIPPTPRTGEAVQMTQRMDPPVRRPRTPTMIIHTNEPTKQQKLLVFMAMLIVVVAAGIAVVVYYRPSLLNLENYSGIRPLPPARPPPPTAAPAVTTAPTLTPAFSAPSASVAPGGSVPLPTATTPAPPPTMQTSSAPAPTISAPPRKPKAPVPTPTPRF